MELACAKCGGSKTDCIHICDDQCVYRHASYLRLENIGCKIPELVYSLKNLQSLKIQNSDITEIPLEILNLQHLTYLNLSYNKISVFPSLYLFSNMCKNGIWLNLIGNNLSHIPLEITNYINQHALRDHICVII
jgi:Leucine-rich repeat (LRR) protein